jgi:hypothetical protein
VSLTSALRLSAAMISMPPSVEHAAPGLLDNQVAGEAVSDLANDNGGISPDGSR